MSDEMNDSLLSMASASVTPEGAGVASTPTPQAPSVTQSPIPTTPSTTPSSTPPPTSAAPEADPLSSILAEAFPSHAPAAPTPATTPAAAGVDARDLSDIDEADKPLFRQMSNDAFHRLAPLYRDHKNGKFVSKAEYEKAMAQAQQASKPVFAYDHEAGYTLSKEYQQLAGGITNEQHDLAYAKEQLHLARSGKPFRWFDRDAQGNFVIRTEASSPTDDNKATIAGWIDETERVIRTAYGELENIKRSHVSAHSQYKNLFSAIQQSLEPHMRNPGFKAEVDKIIGQMVPAQFRGDPKDMIIAQQAVLLNVLTKRARIAGAAQQQVAGGTTMRAAIKTNGAGSSMPGNDLDAINEAALSLR